MPSDPSDSGLGAGLAQTAYPEVAPGQWNSAAQAWQLPPAVTTVVHPSQPLSDDRLFDLGVISPEEYQRRTGRLSPYTGLQSGLFPRAQSALNNDSPYLQQAVGAGIDLASLLGRAYASLGSLPNESYGQALARVSSPDSAEKAYQITDNMFRDPSTALIPLGLGLAGKLPAVASGINALGTAGRVGLDAAANTAAQMANEYGTTGTTSNPLGSGLMNAAMDVGVRGMGGLGSKLARMVSPEGSAANFKRWFAGSKAVDDSYGRPVPFYHGTSNSGFDTFDAAANGGKGLMGEGAYFTSNPDVASGYAAKGGGTSPGVYKTYLSIKNPIDMDAKPDPQQWEKMFPGISDYIGNDWKPNKNEDYLNAFTEMARDNGLPDYEATQALREGFEGAGYDGLTHIGGGRYGNKITPPHKVFVAFDPTQIKSAIGNSGPWDPNNPDIADLIPLEKPNSLSNITANQGAISPEESSKNFKNWFGDSKVLDEAGNPLVVYHGTNSDFDQFNPLQHFGTINAAQDRLKAIGGESNNIIPAYISAAKILKVKDNGLQTPLEIAMAAKEAGANIDMDGIIDKYASSLSKEDMFGIARRLGYIDPNDATQSEIAQDLKDYANKNQASMLMEKISKHGDPREGDYVGDIPSSANDVINALSKEYDALSYLNEVENKGSTSFIPLHSTQIKSAIGNRGTWDPNDPNITHFAPGLSAGVFPNFATLLGNRVNNTARQAAMQQGQQTFGGQQ